VPEVPDNVYRIRCRSDVLFAFGVSFLWLALYNVSFWEQTIDAMWSPSLGSAAFIASVLLLVWCLQAVLLLIMPSRLTMRIAASILFVIASLSSYFTQAYGAVMNTDMLRNAVQTDALEVAGLINIDLLLYVLILGVLPALLVWRVSLPAVTWQRQLQQRIYVISGALIVCAASVLGCSANYVVYLRAHKPIRFALSPAAAVVSATSIAARPRRNEHQPLQDPGGVAHRVAPPHAKPLVLFVVVGETARAGNFQLDGYQQPTTPELAAKDDVIYFSDATSCGTSTAVSVPCMFSHLGRERFDVNEASRYTNVLDSLLDAGFDVEWRDNNSGCKGVCARVSTIDYSNHRDARLCEQSYCYDAIMLEDLGERLRTITRDTVIFFHQIGSHGPAYTERYPEAFERFKPACRTNELQHCSQQEVVNAYDNTIAYTDHVLSRQIEMLRAAADHIDGILIYASDHGESLGEQGIYLHGMPYRFAPRVQKEVPMLLWVSDGYAQREQLNIGCLQQRARAPVSHDALYHTILGAAETRDRAYDSSLDVLSLCRRDLLDTGCKHRTPSTQRRGQREGKEGASSFP
jgi:lipid A ethanolaminephosphotransferase